MKYDNDGPKSLNRSLRLWHNFLYQLVQDCLKLSLITTISGYKKKCGEHAIGVKLHSIVTQSSQSSTTTV